MSSRRPLAPPSILLAASLGLAGWGCLGDIAGSGEAAGAGAGNGGAGAAAPPRGAAGGPAAGPPGTAAGTGGMPGGAQTPTPMPAAPLKVPRGALRRLSVEQYRAAVRDLVGDVALPPTESDPIDEETFSLTAVETSRVVTSAAGVEQYDTAARDAARQVFSDTARRQALVGCAPAGADDPCVRRFLAAFGRRAFRRPMADEELARYTRAVASVAQGFGDVWRGLEAATAAFLAAPSFLYRAEVGGAAPAAPGSKRRLDDYELASRLAFFLWNTAPDGPLLDAAERRELSSPAGLRREAERLLASTRARRAFQGFAAEWLGTRGLNTNGLAKDPKIFPAASLTLAKAMYLEVDGMAGTLVFDRGQDLLGLLATRETFLTVSLAKLYGIPEAVPASAGERATAVTLPADGPRGGLFTTGAFLALAARASMTSPVLRGIFVRERLLCQHVPPPPPEVMANLPPPPPDGRPETMRQRLERHMTDPACAGCHRLTDPIGLAFEAFDGLGAHRTRDAGLPIVQAGSLDGRAFEGPKALAELLRADERVAACAARLLLRQATGSADDDVLGPWGDELGRALRGSGGRLKSFLPALVDSDGFRSVEVSP